MKTKTIFKNPKKVLDRERIHSPELKDLISFCFSDETEVEKFSAKCLEKKRTRRMLNRLQWFVELSDFQEYDSVRILFLIAMAETNIKLLNDRFSENSDETSDVRKFFSRFTEQDKSELQKYFFRTDRFLNKKPFEFNRIVDILINVRHRVVHGKNHYDFRFYDRSDNAINIILGEIGKKDKKRGIQYELEITYNDFRKLMIKNAIENIKECL